MSGRRLVVGTAVILLGCYAYLRFAKPELLSQIRLAVAHRVIEMVPSAPAVSAPAAPQSKPARPPAVSPNQVTLRLNNGGMVTGELVAETAEAVTLRWDYGDVTFARTEIKQLERGRQVEGDDDIVLPASARRDYWPHQHDAVFSLLNGSVLDAELVGVDEEGLRLAKSVEGGGRVELTIPRDQLDQILFRPIDNPRSQEIRQSLRDTFPDMRWYEEGMFTVFTDSPREVADRYRRVIRELATDWYLRFWPLLDGRRASIQQHVVIFDDWPDYIDYAATDGVPGWLAVGYFHPQHEVLHLFNMLGERFSELLYEAYLGQYRQGIDQAVGQIKGSLQDRYHIFLEGQASEIKQLFERRYGTIRAYYNRMTEDTLRHELTHALFHNWGVQTIVLSTMPPDQQDLARQKREYLAADEPNRKRELLMALLKPGSEQPIDIKAANSWVSEGAASYMERLEAVNPERLHGFQQATVAGQILPLEFLNAFKMGSFPGVAQQAALYAYAQSWAMSHFLLHRHPEALMTFMDRLAQHATAGPEAPAEQEELDWLLQAVGTDLRSLEQEFQAYMAQFPPQSDPALVPLDASLRLREELKAL